VRDPNYLSYQPDPPDCQDAPDIRSHLSAITGAANTRNLSACNADDVRTKFGQPQGEASTQLAAHLLALGGSHIEQEKRPVLRVSGQRRAIVA
jgi:hypothetical protein